MFYWLKHKIDLKYTASLDLASGSDSTAPHCLPAMINRLRLHSAMYISKIKKNRKKYWDFYPTVPTFVILRHSSPCVSALRKNR